MSGAQTRPSFCFVLFCFLPKVESEAGLHRNNRAPPVQTTIANDESAAGIPSSDPGPPPPAPFAPTGVCSQRAITLPGSRRKKQRRPHMGGIKMAFNYATLSSQQILPVSATLAQLCCCCCVCVCVSCLLAPCRRRLGNTRAGRRLVSLRLVSRRGMSNCSDVTNFRGLERTEASRCVHFRHRLHTALSNAPRRY